VRTNLRSWISARALPIAGWEPNPTALTENLAKKRDPLAASAAWVYNVHILRHHDADK
jgi:hypothetical protein